MSEDALTREPLDLSDPALPLYDPSQSGSAEYEEPKPSMVLQEVMESVAGRELDTDAFTLFPWGYRILVVREESVTETPGGIIIPEMVQSPDTTGWVYAVGDQVNMWQQGASLSPIAPYGREKLLGAKVMFGMYCGEPFTGAKDKFEADYLMMTCNDVWGHLWLPPEPLDFREAG